MSWRAGYVRTTSSYVEIEWWGYVCLANTPFRPHWDTWRIYIEPNEEHYTPHFYPQSFFMLCKISSNSGLATNGVGCLMLSLHPYPHLRHPPTSLEQRLSIVHLGPDTIQVAPSRGIGAIFPNLMRQPQLINYKIRHIHHKNPTILKTLWTTKNFKIWWKRPNPLAYGNRDP